jgi:pSer/pThr/pTyr-binding forkhead associated (FHA) protein
MGRGQACDLRIEHATMSRVHSRLTWRADAAGWVIEDAGSANGTFVDSTPVTQAMLKPGQTVKLGEVELLFLDSPPPAPRRTRLIVALLLGLLALAVAAVALNIYLSAAG